VIRWYRDWSTGLFSEHRTTFGAQDHVWSTGLCSNHITVPHLYYCAPTTLIFSDNNPVLFWAQYWSPITGLMSEHTIVRIYYHDRSIELCFDIYILSSDIKGVTGQEVVVCSENLSKNYTVLRFQVTYSSYRTTNITMLQ
jgi:hypothetical protein